MKKDWTYKKLGEVADTYRGLTYSKKDEVEHSSKAVLRSNNIDLTSHQLNFDEIKYIREDFVIPQDKLVKKDSIFICMSNGSMQHLGKVAYIDKEYNFAFGGFMGLVVPKEIVNAKYVYYSMLADNFLSTIMKEGKGANINNLRFSDVENYLIPIPPLSIQRSIVAELDLLHSVISKKKEQLRELDNLAQSLFYQMFGAPITNPMGWEIKKLGEVAPVKSYQGDIVSEKGLYWLLNLDMVEAQTGKILEKNMVDKDEIGNSTTSFSPDNVLYSKLRPYLNKVVLPDTCGYCTTELLPLLPQRDILNREYLCYLLRSKSFVDYINIKVAGAKMPRVTMDDFRNFSIPLPPLSLQQSFSAKVSAIEAQKQAITQSIKETEALLAQRMDTYFS